MKKSLWNRFEDRKRVIQFVPDSCRRLQTRLGQTWHRVPEPMSEGCLLQSFFLLRPNAPPDNWRSTGDPGRSHRTPIPDRFESGTSQIHSKLASAMDVTAELSLDVLIGL